MIDNRAWFQYLLYFLILVMLPALTLFLLFAAIKVWLSDGFYYSLIFIVWGVLSAYLNYKYLSLLRFISTKVIYNEKKFTVENNHKKTDYLWSDIADVKHYEFAGLLHIYDSNNRPIYICHKKMPGFYGFNDIVKNRHELLEA